MRRCLIVCSHLFPDVGGIKEVIVVSFVIGHSSLVIHPASLIQGLIGSS
jgi:hypothetical protein